MKKKIKNKFNWVAKSVCRLSPFLKKNQVSNKDCPDECLLKFWGSSEWIEYQAWIYHKGFVTQKKWYDLRKKSLELLNPPLISIVMPTFNTDPEMLQECVYSVQTQAYHNWELCVVDDGSANSATIDLLNQIDQQDNRVHVFMSPENKGICRATNQALAMAKGDFIAFLDHDDRLAPEALYSVADALSNNPDIDVVYSDRDMLSLRGLRFMHLFKPDWSPELLFSMNYICHLMVYRKSIVDRVGGIHDEFEGSQDYDLILRVMELNPLVHHIEKVLYHWRQNEQSVALNHDAKTYAYKAGVRALEHALQRRGLKGDVRELSDLWRGHYRVRLEPPLPGKTAVITIPEKLSMDSYAAYIREKIEAVDKEEFVVFIGSEMCRQDEKMSDAVQEMVSWFQVDRIGIVTGRVINTKRHIRHAGMVQKPDGIPLFIYEGYDESEPGYIASTMVVRNVSQPFSSCFAVRKSLWHQLGGLDVAYKGPHSILDLSIRVLQNGFRILYTPFAEFVGKEEDSFAVSLWPPADRIHFIDKWEQWLQKGDPYYNRHLILKLSDMGLNADIDDAVMETFKKGNV